MKSNGYFTIYSKRMQLFEIFKYLSLVHNAVFGDYNGDYSRQKRDKLLPFRMTVVAENGDKLLLQIVN